MNNFARSLRLCLRYRFTLIASLVCALSVALLWGDIGTLYPMVEIVVNGESLPSWAERRIQAYRNKIADEDAELAQLAADPAAAAADHRRALELKREADAHVLELYEWAQGNFIAPYFGGINPFQTLVLVIVLFLLGTLVKSAFLTTQCVLVTRLTQLAVIDLRKQVYRCVLRDDMARFNSEGTSELLSRFTFDMESLSEALVEFFGKLIREPLKLIACLVGAACVSWRLLLFSLIVAPPAAYLIRRLAKALKRANRKLMEEMSGMYGILDETFQGIKVVKAFTMERQERRRFHLTNKAYFRRTMRIGWYDSLIRPLTEMLGIMTICTAMLAGAYLVLNHETHLFGIRLCDRPPSLGMMLLFFGMLAGTTDPARKLSEVFSRLQRGAAAADRIYQLVDRRPSVVDPRTPVLAGRHRRDLVFENVRFGYLPTQIVLKDVSLRIAFGETIAVVGANGCGKSTLANLIPRFFDPGAGRVLLDGVDLRDLRLRAARTDRPGDAGDAAVQRHRLQQHPLRRATGDAGSGRRRRRAGPRPSLYRRSAGRGLRDDRRAARSRLSGGQRQRIALARAILRDPAILILDEATSQIDLESEQVIHKVLERFVRNRTTVIITHRLSTLTLADRIVVMNAGGIVDVGTHEELIGRCEFYGRLHDLQFRETA